jgi:1,2-diacylglycerol 3-alpha-glucosyltransferase
MKIGFFVDTYYPQYNGVVVSVEQLVEQLRAHGHKVYIFAPLIKGYKDKDKYIYRIPSFKMLNGEPDIFMPKYLSAENLKTIKDLKFDIVHAHGNGAFSALGLATARLKRIPYVLTFHTMHKEYTHFIMDGKLIKPKMAEIFLKTFGNICDATTTPSEKMKKELLEYGVKRPIEVIPNFIDFSEFSVKNKAILRKKLNIQQSASIVLSVGRLDKAKNFEFLVRAFSKIKNKNAVLVIVGKGPRQNNLNSLAVKYKIEDKVYFAGAFSYEEMPYIYKDADIFVFSSRSETQGVVVLEAAASGLPLVVTDDPAYKGMAEDGVNSFVVPFKEDLFAQKLDLLLSDKKLRERYSNSSKKVARENFDPKTWTERLVNFYKETIENYNSRDSFFKRLYRSFSYKI